jgi:RNA 2',3'-cyclic 3'-phosphodiesterase
VEAVTFGSHTTVMSPRTPRPPKDRPPAPDAVDAPWRLFLAVPLPEEVRKLAGREIERLMREGWPVRWVQSESAHLTLHFLGETTPERAELVRLSLPNVVAAHAPFDLRTAAFGVFPNFRRPRVLWLGLHGPVHRLETLQRDIGRSLRELDFVVGEEPFNPHITLGRVRDSAGERVRLRELPERVKAAFVDRASGAAIAPPATPVPVREVVLMRSYLGQGPPRYEQVASFSLGSRGDERE